MSVRRKHVCITCGRPFPEGQGIILNIGGEILEFHSSKCFAKFAKELFERMPPEEIRGYVRKVREEFQELLEQKKKLKAKKIA